MGVNKWINGEELHDETLIKLVENNFGVKFQKIIRDAFNCITEVTQNRIASI